MKTDDYMSWEKLKLGDELAYEQLYKEHYRILCLFACKFVKNIDVAESIVSDVFFNIWDKREVLQITVSLRSYLMQSVRNRSLNYIEQESRRKELLQDLYNANEASSLSPSKDLNDPLTNLLIKELDLKISKSIAKLPESTQLIFKLSRFHEMKYSEISKSTGLSIDSIKYHIKSALSKLREELF